jgi:hypothetical protein
MGQCVPLTTPVNCGALGHVCSGATSQCTVPADGGTPSCTQCAANDFQCQCNAFIANNEVGNTVSSTCSGTEVTLFEKDPSGACLNCALKKSCIDDTIGTGDVGQECEDLTASSSVSLCEATLQCEIGVDPLVTPSPLNVGTSRTLTNAFCGTASPTSCQNATTNAGLGSCAPQIENGMPGVALNGGVILGNLLNLGFPSGQADTIVACLLRTSGGQCTTCVN